ncbi:type VI secretion system baseplate subunit TssE [Pseudomonas fontis]|uniref:Type VI secretion system baseplate subunit TssE n=1 Tax=Pseudomonas fontis TaxID=2942633 RepID=A0ABT5NTV1_9PSED|nr:type VI secretion system baseplate subunit TssE [Pseudomonas fontis]MDD0974504.1 type VI secretion system baseplate subunit TssE [Pseudomonas fontis]MDD0991598.1 type VI secretion system baseplate subunit TssE [Pseudomonas fontis]
MPASGQRPLLFDRLASSADESPYLDRYALADSVREELLRLLNSRRGGPLQSTPPTLLDYGIADWSALQASNSDDRRRIGREVSAAVKHFEPRLEVSRVDVRQVPGQPRSLSILLEGYIRHEKQQWPVAFVVEKTDAGLEVSHERLD